MTLFAKLQCRFRGHDRAENYAWKGLRFEAYKCLRCGHTELLDTATTLWHQEFPADTDLFILLR